MKHSLLKKEITIVCQRKLQWKQNKQTFKLSFHLAFVWDLSSASLLELTGLLLSADKGLDPRSKGVAFFSLFESLWEDDGFTVEDRRGDSKYLLATSGGGVSSPGSTSRPFSRREDGSLKQELHRESRSCLSSLTAPRSSSDIKLILFILSWRSCFIFSLCSSVWSFVLWASSRRLRRAASLTSESSLEARCMNIRGNPSSFTMLQSELFSCNR